MSSRLVNVTNPKSLPHLTKVVDLLAEYYKNNDGEITKYKHRGKRSPRLRFNTVEEYSILAMKCIACHRFDTASAMLDIVCQELAMDATFFYKGAAIVLENHPRCTVEDFSKFAEFSLGLSAFNKYEARLEFLVYTFRKNLDAELQLQHLERKMVAFQKKQNLKNFIVHPLLELYSGMHHYVKWANSIHDEFQKPFEESADAFITSVANIICKIDESADESPPIFDIFILKLMEVLIYYGRLEELHSILYCYAETCNDHINSYIYLCWFLLNYKSDDGKLIRYLKRIAKICPSDERVLQLVDLMKDKDFVKSLKWLFKFLDYPSNSNCYEGWKKMSDLLIEACENHLLTELKAALTFWNRRHYVWHHIHFNPTRFNFESERNATTIMYKVITVSLLEKSNPFVQNVIQHCSAYPQVLEKLTKKISYVEKLKERYTSYYHTHEGMDIS